MPRCQTILVDFDQEVLSTSFLIFFMKSVQINCFRHKIHARHNDNESAYVLRTRSFVSFAIGYSTLFSLMTKTYLIEY